MMFGDFLDSFPPALFILTHLILLGIGVWAAMKAKSANLSYAPALWLYAASQIVFIGFFTLGLYTIKMTILTEQILVMVMVIWIAMKSGQPTES